jgi:hypothetical protein
MSSKRTPNKVITGSLDDRRDGESDVQPRRYVRARGRTGFHVVKRECNEEEIVVTGSRAFAPGTQVNTARHSGRPGEAIITEPPPGRAGVSAFPINIVVREIDVLEIVSADPSIVDAGFNDTVVLTGIGFSESPLDTFTPVQFNTLTAEWEADPLVSAGAPTWVDAQTVILPLTVLSSAPEGYQISIDPRRA